MPYSKNSELPETVRDKVPEHGQDIYRKAFNSAWEQYKDPSEKGRHFPGRDCSQGRMECREERV